MKPDIYVDETGLTSDFITVLVEEYYVIFSLDRGFFNDRQKEFCFPYHSHAEYELHVVTQGSCNIHFEDEAVILSEGSCCVILPNVYHTLVIAPDAVLHSSCLKFFIQNRNNRAEGDNIAISSSKYNLWMDDGSLITHIKNATGELDSDHLFRQIKLRAIFTELFIDVMRSISVPENNSSSETVDQSVLRRRSCIEYFFNMNFSKQITIDDLANELCVGRRQTSREVRRYFGMSFKEKHIKTRMGVAKRFLEQSNSSLERIALSVGYEALASFSMMFKRHTGISPSVYRQRSRIAGWIEEGSE